MAVCVVISSKDSRRLHFLFPLEDKDGQADKVVLLIRELAFSTKDETVSFAFLHRLPRKHFNGWNVLNDAEEYKRMGLNFASKVLISLIAKH